MIFSGLIKIASTKIIAPAIKDPVSIRKKVPNRRAKTDKLSGVESGASIVRNGFNEMSAVINKLIVAFSHWEIQIYRSKQMATYAAADIAMLAVTGLTPALYNNAIRAG